MPGLLREKALTLLEALDDVLNGLHETLWTRAMFFTCDVANKSTTTSPKGSKSLYELWFETN